MPNFFNPFTEFQRPDFSLWAQPDEHSVIEDKPGPLQPRPTSPLYGANAAPLSPDTVNAGGITMPAPKAAPLGPTAKSPINQNQSALGKLHDKIRNHITGDVPQGYEGMLSPEEINAARPNLMQSLFTAPDQPMAAARWTRNLDDLVAHKQQSAGIIANQRVQAATSKIFADNPPPKNGTAAEYAKWANVVHPQLIAAGNYGAAKELAPIVEEDAKSAAGVAAAAAKPFEGVWEDIGGEKVFTNKQTGAVISRIKKTPAPKDAAAVSADQKNAQDQQNKILDDFARDTKDFHQVMGGWDVLKGATKDPSLATPFAVTDAYARITNPGGIVRPTTMEMIDNMGSIGQRMRKYWEHNANGALPDDIMRDFKKTLYNIVQEHKTQFDQIRSQAILRGSRSGVTDIQALLQNYEVQDPNLPPAVTKYKIDPVRK